MTELICGACRGRMRVVDPSETVVCPHCGALVPPPTPSVTTPDATQVEALPQVEAPSPTPAVTDDPRIAAADHHDVSNLLVGEHTRLDSANPAFLGDLATAGEASPDVDAFQNPDELDPRSTLVEFIVPPLEAADSVPELHQGQELGRGFEPIPPVNAMEAANSSVAAEADDPYAPFVPRMELTATNATETDNSSTENWPSNSSPRGSVAVSARGVSRLAFMLVLSYASAMTLACAYLYYEGKNNPGTLDLPDLVPPAQITNSKKGVSSRKIQYRLEEKAVPAANVLTIGQSRQYGSIRVTPLRVTRGPVEFTFYKPEDNQKKEPEGPVLKLHLRFENVSTDQEFIPLDSILVYSKYALAGASEPYNPHNFVSRVSDRGVRAKHAYALDLQVNGAWLVKDQRLDEDLAPGQSLETFIPTTAEDLESLEGDLVWRFHFRKGYNRTSGRGVTTLIEVMFKSSDIIDETASGATPDPEQPADQKSTAKDA